MKKVIISFLILAAAFTLASTIKCYGCSRLLAYDSSCIDGVQSELENDEFTTDCDGWKSQKNADMCVTFSTDDSITRGCGNFYAKSSNPHAYLKEHEGAQAVFTCHTDYCNYGKLSG